MSAVRIDELLDDLLVQGRHDATEQLYRHALPAIYRDEQEATSGAEPVGAGEDLRSYLEAFGAVLDQIRGTLDARLGDISPLTCQTWLLPYLADLLNVRLVSPDVAGQREEIARAVRWRQRKGTISVCVEIAETILQQPVIPYEGHEGIARTPRPGTRLPTLRELGEVGFWRPDPATPSRMAERPGTPAVTVDFRKRSQPRRLVGGDVPSLVLETRFGDEEVRWQHENRPHGVPCHVGGYRDVAIRTVDVRDPCPPSIAQAAGEPLPNDRPTLPTSTGHHHPRRLRLYTPMPEGFLRADDRSAIAAEAVRQLVKPMGPPDAQAVWHGVTRGGQRLEYLVRRETLPMAATGGRYVRVEERIRDRETSEHVDEAPGLRIRSTLLSEDEAEQALVVPADWDARWPGHAFLLQWERYADRSEAGEVWHSVLSGGHPNSREGRSGDVGSDAREASPQGDHDRWPTIAGSLEIERPSAAGDHAVELRGLTVTDRMTLHSDYTRVIHLGARELRQRSTANSGLEAAHCLFHTLDGSLGEVRLVYCTVSSALACEILKASDCILLGALQPTASLSLRFSCAPMLVPSTAPPEWRIHKASVHSGWPELHGQQIGPTGARTLPPSRFGERGYGVLKQSAHPSIRRGAEDGGEMGAFHHRWYCARQDAVAEKLGDFLPVGMKPVLVVDENWSAPVERRSREQMK